MTNIDEATGLPELPENYFWRVRPTHKDSPYLRIEMMRGIKVHKRDFLGFRKLINRNEVVEWGAVSKDEATPQEVLRTACYVLRKSTNTPVNWEAVVGEYPPKKLEA